MDNKNEKGVWVKLTDKDYFFCDKCGEKVNIKKDKCPNCGREMI